MNAMTTTERGGIAFRESAAANRKRADGFRKLASGYSGDVRERMMLLAEYHERLAATDDWCAGSFERIASRQKVAS